MTCLNRDRSPVSQNGLFTTKEAAQAAAVAPLAIRVCISCGFVFNSAFGAGVEYDGTYENDQTSSPAFARHVDAIAGCVLSALSGQHAAVALEVGCGQGHFLERLVTLGEPRIRAAFGFDPAWRRRVMRPRISIRAGYFDGAAAQELPPIDVAVSRHVIEHVEEPVAFLASIAAALPTGALLFLETPCVQWILDGGVIQDFFFEHCSYFTAETLRLALLRGGFREPVVEHVFDGQYLWASARVGQGPARVEVAREAVDRTLGSARRFAETQNERVRGAREQVTTLLKKVAIWGAGAKGVTFANTIDPEADLVECVIDINTKKQGGFIPVTAHPIVSPIEAMARGVRSIVIMNPNYRQEIEREIATHALGFQQLIYA
jgi:SAM-dependent methyltransferase